MKFAILLLVLFITPTVPRFHNDDEENNDIYELADLLKDRFKHQKHHPKPSYRPEELDNDNERDEDSSPEYPSVFPGEEVHPSRKKVLSDSEPDDDDGATTRSSSTSPPSMTEASDPSACVDKYETRPEQLVKVKDLTDGAHLIRYVLIDKRTLPAGEKVNDACMLNCCSEATCDLAMLSEQPTHDGYKCYLFACNGGCTLASHQDYTVMTRTSILAAPKVNPSPPTSTVGVNRAPRRSALFRNTAVIIFLVFGIVSTAVLLFLLVKHCRQPRRYNRKLKNYSVDEDYLINGLYL